MGPDDRDCITTGRLVDLFCEKWNENEQNGNKQTTLTYRDLTIEKENRVVRRGDEIIELTKREYELLLTLMENINVVLARDTLLKKVWGYETNRNKCCGCLYPLFT